MCIELIIKEIEAQKALLSASLINVSIAYLIAFIFFLFSYSKQINQLILIFTLKELHYLR